MKKLIIEVTENNGKCDYFITTKDYSETSTFTTTCEKKEPFSYFEIIGIIENVKNLIISRNN